jgi:hypothetical protein
VHENCAAALQKMIYTAKIEIPKSSLVGNLGKWGKSNYVYGNFRNFGNSSEKLRK